MHKNEHIKSKPTLRRSVLTKTRDGLKQSRTSWNHLIPPETTQELAKITLNHPANNWYYLMMIMMIIMNCFCGMVDRRKAFSVISSWVHCKRSSPTRISDTPRLGYEPAQNLSSGLVELSCAVVITTTLRCHKKKLFFSCVVLMLRLKVVLGQI